MHAYMVDQEIKEMWPCMMKVKANLIWELEFIHTIQIELNLILDQKSRKVSSN